MLINPLIVKKYYNKDHKSILFSIMYQEVVSWLNPKISNFIIDYMNIKSGILEFGVDGLSDYSYLITPAFKALEGTLLEIGKEMGFDLGKYHYKVGVIFNEENLEKYYKDVLDRIQHLSSENKIDIKQWLDNARRILKSLRHTPAHYEGDVKENWTKAFLSGDLIITTINEMCYVLICNDLFPSIIVRRKKEQEERLRREGKKTILGLINK